MTHRSGISNPAMIILGFALVLHPAALERVFSAAPDLVVDSLSVNPSSKQAGGRAIIIFSIRNLGNAASNPCAADARLNTSSTEVLPDDPAIDLGISIPGLAPNGTFTGYDLVVIPIVSSIGLHGLWLTADANGQAGQSDRTNDSSSVPFNVAESRPPNLVVWGPGTNPTFTTETYAANDCAVVEGCIQPGTRKLLRFNAETHNVGEGDLIPGDPVGNPRFYFSPCHGHYHLRSYLDFRLRDDQGRIAAGFKEGFCVLDTVRFDSSANTIGVYDCDYQGLQSGWGDIYSAGLPCQWIDITGVPGGSYTLEMEVNPDHFIPEADYSNNVTQVAVVIPGATPTPGPTPVRDAAPIEHTIPSTLAPGQSVGVGITMKNTGNTTWADEDHYALAVVSDPCSMFPENRIPLRLGDFVGPNEKYEFIAQIQIPDAEQSCGLTLRMIQEPLGFGEELDAVILVAIPPNAALDWTLYE